MELERGQKVVELERLAIELEQLVIELELELWVIELRTEHQLCKVSCVSHLVKS